MSIIIQKLPYNYEKHGIFGIQCDIPLLLFIVSENQTSSNVKAFDTF